MTNESKHPELPTTVGLNVETLKATDEALHKACKGYWLAHGKFEAVEISMGGLLKTYSQETYTYDVHHYLRESWIFWSIQDKPGRARNTANQAFGRFLKLAGLEVPKATSIDSQEKRGQRGALRALSDNTLTAAIADCEAKGETPPKSYVAEIKRREKEKEKAESEARSVETKALQAMIDSGAVDVHALLLALKGGQFAAKVETAKPAKTAKTANEAQS